MWTTRQKLIRLVNDKVKPVTAFTDGAMFSAAYYLGSSASEVTPAITRVGSIGVIATHMEQSQFLKDMGIGVTVIRAAVQSLGQQRRGPVRGRQGPVAEER